MKRGNFADVIKVKELEVGRLSWIILSRRTLCKHIGLYSCNCCNKLWQIGWLKNIRIYSLEVMEGRSLQSSCHQGHTPSGGSGQIPSFPFLASSGSKFPLICSCITLICLCDPIASSSSLCLFFCLPQISLCLSLIKTLIIFRAQPDNPG